jgi:hypothetical protein
MSDDDPVAHDPSPPPSTPQPPPASAQDLPQPPPAPPEEKARVAEGETPAHVRDRLRGIAARLREAAENLGGEVMIEIPSRLGDHEGLLLALANELEQLVK